MTAGGRSGDRSERAADPNHPHDDWPSPAEQEGLPPAPVCPPWCQVHVGRQRLEWDQATPTGTIKSCRRRFPEVSAEQPRGAEVEIERFATVDFDTDPNHPLVELTEPAVSLGPFEFLSAGQCELLARQLLEAAHVLRSQNSTPHVL
jgi:hypothetical protein